jgi:hypothetical protein
MAWQEGTLTGTRLRSVQGGTCVIRYHQKSLQLKMQARKTYRRNERLTLTVV